MYYISASKWSSPSGKGGDPKRRPLSCLVNTHDLRPKGQILLLLAVRLIWPCKVLFGRIRSSGYRPYFVPNMRNLGETLVCWKNPGVSPSS